MLIINNGLFEARMVVLAMIMMWICLFGCRENWGTRKENSQSNPFFFLSFCFSNFVFWEIKGWDICPSINQSPIRATLCTENPGDPPASTSSEVPPAVLTSRAAAARPCLHPHSPLPGGQLGFAILFMFLFFFRVLFVFIDSGFVVLWFFDLFFLNSVYFSVSWCGFWKCFFFVWHPGVIWFMSVVFF